MSSKRYPEEFDLETIHQVTGPGRDGYLARYYEACLYVWLNLWNHIDMVGFDRDLDLRHFHHPVLG